MAKEFNCEIEDIIEIISSSDKHDWAKAIAKVSWNGNPATIDIRNMNVGNNFMGKGISLKDEEVDKIVEVLVSRGYGSTDELDQAIRERKKNYIVIDSGTDIIEDVKYTIKVDI